MQHPVLDRLLPLSVLLLPSLCLPIPTPSVDPSWELGGLYNGHETLCLGSSTFSNILLKPTDENDIAELILADYTGYSSNLQFVTEEEEEFSPDSDEQAVPHSSLRKRTERPSITSQPVRQGQQRSKSTNDVSSDQRPNRNLHRTWSDSHLQTPIQRVHEPVKVEDTIQDRIERGVARFCGGFDDLRDEFVSTTGESVTFQDFRRCVKDITKRVTSTTSTSSQRPGVWDITGTMHTVAKAVEKFKVDTSTEQRRTDSARKLVA